MHIEFHIHVVFLETRHNTKVQFAEEYIYHMKFVFDKNSLYLPGFMKPVPQ